MKVAKVEDFFNQYGGYTREEMLKRAIEFAQAHSEAALKAAAENAEAKENSNDYGTGKIWVDEKSILSAYPLTNIK